MNRNKQFANCTFKDNAHLTNREITDEKQSLNDFYTAKKLKHDSFVVLFVGIFIGFLSPFGMDEMPVLLSISYWVVVCFCGYFIYSPLVFLGEQQLKNCFSKQIVRVALSTLVASMVMSFVIPLINWLLFDMKVALGEQFFSILPKAIVIGGVLTFFSMLQSFIKQQGSQLAQTKKLNEVHQQKVQQVDTQQLDKFMEQLPVEKRGKLLCLEMSDHYIKVYTDKGHHLVLMRFKDALSALSKFPGLQTHRSWWIAKDAVVTHKKDGRKILLVLSNKLEVPVSRTYMAALKAENLC